MVSSYICNTEIGRIDPLPTRVKRTAFLRFLFSSHNIKVRNMEEIWKDIRGFDGKYQVSNFGRVRSFHFKFTDEPIILAQRNVHGYRHVHLKYNGKHFVRSVHRLVAIEFIDNPQNKPEIDHIDCDRTNNRVDNLRWCTTVENRNNPITAERHRIATTGKKRTEEQKQRMRLAHKGLLSGEKHPMYGKKLSDEQKMKISLAHKDKDGRSIVQLTKDGHFVKEWACISTAARFVHASTGSLVDCCKGRKKSIKGYKWKYLSDYEQEKEG